MQSLVGRCQHQCTRHIPGAIRMRPTASSPPSCSSSASCSRSSSTSTRTTTATPSSRPRAPVSPAAAAHGRFFSVCRSTMVGHPNTNTKAMLYATPPHQMTNSREDWKDKTKENGKVKKAFSGRAPRKSRKTEVGVVQLGIEEGSMSSGVESATGSGGVNLTAGNETTSTSTTNPTTRVESKTSTGPKPMVPRPRTPEIVGPAEMITFWDTCAWLLRHGAHEFGYRLLPDGFAPITDMLRYEGLAHVTPKEFISRIRLDPGDRFEITMLPDYINGVAQEKWWVRARSGHTIPGVSYKSKRILNSSKLIHVVYTGPINEWETIRKRGLEIRSFKDFVIPLSQKKQSDIFHDYIPPHTTLLAIRINADLAIQKGVMFFHDVDTRLISTGNRDGVIPPSVFHGAIELDVSKKVLKE